LVGVRGLRALMVQVQVVALMAMFHPQCRHPMHWHYVKHSDGWEADCVSQPDQSFRPVSGRVTYSGSAKRTRRSYDKLMGTIEKRCVLLPYLVLFIDQLLLRIQRVVLRVAHGVSQAQARINLKIS
jgi:hypothetical protein